MIIRFIAIQRKLCGRKDKKIMNEFILENDELRYHYLVKRDGNIYNMDKKMKFVKPYKDKRRPNEPPQIYMKKKDGKRVFYYHDELIASIFIPGYDKNTMHVHHLDGDPTNCSADNLYAADGLSTLRDVYKETKEWCKVDIGQKLYYDYYICEDGRLFNGTTSSYVEPFRDLRNRNENYLRYNLYIGKTSRDVIHYAAARLVALHFIVKPEGKDIVIYRDCNNLNVDRSNLYWGDRYDVQNKHHMYSRIFTSIDDPVLGKEEWKYLDIDGLDYEYMVSSFGRVYNNTKKFFSSQHQESEPNRNNQYHIKVSLSMNGDYMEFSLHRLIATVFVKNDDPSTKIYVNHINGNPECNLALNLEWCTPYENLHHAIETNLMGSNKFDGRVDDKYWRLNTFFAWVFTLNGMTIEKSYNFYCSYNRDYDDDLPKLNYAEYVNAYNEKQHDADYIKLAKFYQEKYTD